MRFAVLVTTGLYAILITGLVGYTAAGLSVRSHGLEDDDARSRYKAISNVLGGTHGRADLPWRRVAATPRRRRGYSAETGSQNGDWVFAGTPAKWACYVDMFPFFVTALQFGAPLCLAVCYALTAALGNSSSVRDLVSHAWILVGHVFCSFGPYVLALPCYVGLMHLYAMARLHDLSWGTRDTSCGDELASRARSVEAVAASYRRDVLLYNGLLLIATFCLDLVFGETGVMVILAAICVAVTVPALVHVIGSLAHLARHICSRWRFIVFFSAVAGASYAGIRFG